MASSVFRLFVGLSVLAAMVALLSLIAPSHRASTSNLAVPVSGGEKHRRHAEAMRQREIEQRFSQGVAMLQMRQFEHAVTAFHRVLELSPMLPEAHINLGFALYELADFKGAEMFFIGAKALTPSLPNAVYGLGIAQQAQGNLSGAEASFKEYLSMTRDGDPFREKALSRLQEIAGAAGTAAPAPRPAGGGSQ